MDSNSLHDLKSNIFDHLLYEFEMYFFTYRKLRRLSQRGGYDQFMINVLCESHAVHLRNIIEFFNQDKDCITTKDIFVGELDFSFDDSTIKAKQTINKAIDHLTKQRYTWNRTSKDLTDRFNDVITKMYNAYIVCRIERSVQFMIHETYIKSNLVDKLHDEQIQFRLKELNRICKYTLR